MNVYLPSNFKYPPSFLEILYKVIYNGFPVNKPFPMLKRRPIKGSMGKYPAYRTWAPGRACMKCMVRGGGVYYRDFKFIKSYLFSRKLIAL